MPEPTTVRGKRAVPPRNTEVPGPRARITVDVAEAAIPDLLAGVEAVKFWLTDEGDGVYSFHATQTVGQSRKQAGRAAVDVLTELVNELGEALDGDDVPQRLRDLWDSIVERYEAQTGPRRKEPS